MLRFSEPLWVDVTRNLCLLAVLALQHLGPNGDSSWCSNEDLTELVQYIQNEQQWPKELTPESPPPEEWQPPWRKAPVVFGKPSPEWRATRSKSPNGRRAFSAAGSNRQQAQQGKPAAGPCTAAGLSGQPGLCAGQRLRAGDTSTGSDSGAAAPAVGTRMRRADTWCHQTFGNGTTGTTTAAYPPWWGDLADKSQREQDRPTRPSTAPRLRTRASSAEGHRPSRDPPNQETPPARKKTVHRKAPQAMSGTSPPAFMPIGGSRSRVGGGVGGTCGSSGGGNRRRCSERGRATAGLPGEWERPEDLPHEDLANTRPVSRRYPAAMQAQCPELRSPVVARGGWAAEVPLWAPSTFTGTSMTSSFRGSLEDEVVDYDDSGDSAEPVRLPLEVTTSSASSSSASSALAGRGGAHSGGGSDPGGPGSSTVSSRLDLAAPWVCGAGPLARGDPNVPAVGPGSRLYAGNGWAFA